MRRKRENWLVTFYKQNTFYVWIAMGLVVIVGLGIGMSLGKMSLNNEHKSSGISYDNIENTENNAVYETKTIDIISDKEEEKENVSKENKVVITQADLINEESVPTISDSVLKENETEEEKKEKELVFILPVDGENIKPYSEDTLIYSKTLEEWTMHTGVDFAAKIGDPVKAIEDGVVIDIKNDPRYGYIIVIDHGQGYKSIYCNLSVIDMVKVGSIVQKGQVISGVGDTALFEIKDNSHLHFELMKNDEIVNPLNYISQGED